MLHFNCLITDEGTVNQSIPIVLPLSTEDKERLEDNSAISLCYNGICYAVLYRPEFFYHRKEERVARQFGTTHNEHPYIKVSTY